jgi:cytochrome c biogenesis protein ResB
MGGAHWLQPLASTRLTLWLFALFGLCITVAYLGELPMTWLLAIPLLLLAANLVAAIAVHPALRRKGGLLVFHLALLVLVLLVAAGRLSSLQGQLELAEGEAFSGALTSYEAGPLHPWGLRQTHFIQGPFSIAYHPGPNRGATHSRVYLADESGQQSQKLVGDNAPLLLRGYRFYTTSNKGFAPLFRWQPISGEAQQGNIHLPSYPAHEHKQALTWSPPGSGIDLWTQLQFDEVIIDAENPSQFRIPQKHHLIVRHDTARYELTQGQRLTLPGGTLEYLGLRTWMGYEVFYDWTLPWLLAASFLAVLGLAWHYWSRFAARPWLTDADYETE